MTISLRQFLRLAVVLGAGWLAICDVCEARPPVDATSRPGGKWIPRETVSLADFPAVAPDARLDSYGGLPTSATTATGFFHTQKLGGRWWFVTPQGGVFLSRGVNSVNLATTPDARSAVETKFGSKQAWQEKTLDLLRANGINTLGAWSDSSFLDRPGQPMAQAVTWSFMSAYGAKRGGTHQAPGHTGYPGDCPFLFDPAFPDFCQTYAKRLAAGAANPRVLGNFSDNELPWSRKMLERYLALPAADPGHTAASAWLASRGVRENQIKDADRTAFLGFAVERYLRVVSAAIREAAPKQLFLGPRIHGAAIRCPEVFAALGKYCDVVSVNWYGSWTPDPKLLEMWNRESGKPVLISEFYAKAASSGLANTGGAGWVVKTQADRGAYYQNFALGLLRSGVCIGWHWHRYADNDPADKRLDPSNRDSNKGIVTNRYEPFPELLDSMRALNLRCYNLARAFAAKRTAAR